MDTIERYTLLDIKKIGFAAGVTSAILYIGCALIMAISGPQTTAQWANNILHGIDVTTILKKEQLSFLQLLSGIVEIFILGWLSAALAASIYNFSLKKH
jgi:hypothetical protein